ncbi:hypothetical protein OC842_007655 [Tilletia horrida]|uniref:OPT-domain-containing protein n=1 Tax=Tilletia horrida TaxID=155126 RepID=A0AAN6G519_9BASI|nr:hypothetical protein OC842_007655 [Tilletia horrida]
MDQWAEHDDEDEDGGTLDPEEDDLDDEDDYESEDDGDVFAFVPPDIGPSVALTTNPNDPVLESAPPSGSRAAAAAAGAAAGGGGPSSSTPAAGVRPSTSQSHSISGASNSRPPPPPTSASQRTALSSRGERGTRPPSAVAMPPGTASLLEPAAEEDETFYYDEATGAVYDSQGRLVQMPDGFDPGAVMAQEAVGTASADNTAAADASAAEGGGGGGGGRGGVGAGNRTSGMSASRGVEHELGAVGALGSASASAGAGAGAGAGARSSLATNQSQQQPLGPSHSALALDSIIHRTDADQSNTAYPAYAFPSSSNANTAAAGGGAAYQHQHQPGAGYLAHPAISANLGGAPDMSVDGADRSRKDSHRSSFSLDAGSGYPAALRHAASVNDVGLLASSDALAATNQQQGGGGGVGARGGDEHSHSHSHGHAVGMAYGGEDMAVGPGAQLGGRQQSLGAGMGMGMGMGMSMGLMSGSGLLAGKNSSEDSEDSKLKLDGDRMMMDNGGYYTLDVNDPKALEAAGYGPNGGIGPDGMMMMPYPLGTGNGLMHPVHEGTPVGPRGVRIVELEMETEEDSPYPEVRASVSNVDDPDMPVNTIRMWFLALVFITIAGGANQLFSLRFPSVYLTPVIVQLLSFPAGKLLAATMPIRIWTLPRWLGGASFSLNPGMFNIKEHTAIFIMANVATGPVYALNMIIVLDHPFYYNRPTSPGYQFLLALTSQLFAFSYAGFVRKMLVYPASMIWPLNLVIATIFNTLHAEDDGEDGTMTRFRFFSIWGVAAFVFYFFPGFIFTALSAFNFVCWIWPREFPLFHQEC